MKHNRDRADVQPIAHYVRGNRWSAQKQERRTGISAVNLVATSGLKMASKDTDVSTAAFSFALNARDEQ
jgi:hypothetical protein